MNGDDLLTEAIRKPVNGRKGGPLLRVSFGEVLILLSLILGLIFQYANFTTRISEFEGYTRAKIESIENEQKRTNNLVERLILGTEK